MKIVNICEAERLNVTLNRLCSYINFVEDNPYVSQEHIDSFYMDMETLKKITDYNTLDTIINNKRMSTIELTFAFVGIGLSLIFFFLEQTLESNYNYKFLEYIAIAIGLFAVISVFLGLYLVFNRMTQNRKIKKLAYICQFLKFNLGELK